MIEEFTLLYVEDNKDTQNYMKELLKYETKEFYQAYNGEEGLALYKEKKPDIIISDINMPIVGGFEMSKKIKEIDSEQIIIILSSLSDIKTIKNSIDINIDGYINKPIIDVKEFLLKIHEKLTLLKYKNITREEDKVKLLLNLIKEISHHWKQPLNLISSIASTYTFKYEHDIEITSKDIQNFEMITSTVGVLSNVLEQVEQIDLKNKDIDNLLNIIKISNPIYDKQSEKEIKL